MDSGIRIGLTDIFTTAWRTAANIHMSLISPETRVHDHFAADSMYLLLPVFYAVEALKIHV